MKKQVKSSLPFFSDNDDNPKKSKFSKQSVEKKASYNKENIKSYSKKTEKKDNKEFTYSDRKKSSEISFDKKKNEPTGKEKRKVYDSLGLNNNRKEDWTQRKKNLEDGERENSSRPRFKSNKPDYNNNKNSEYKPDIYKEKRKSSEYKKSDKSGKRFTEKRYGKIEKDEEIKSNSNSEQRLNKVISNAGICSRREADKLIESGVISVNGKIITELGYKVLPSDVIHYGSELLRKEKPVYILINKPKDYITTADDPEKRKTVMELIKGACKERVYPVGRLDRNTTGVLLLTNDGELTKILTHPKYEKEKIYHVTLDKPLARIDVTEIRKGVELEDGIVKVDEIEFVEEAGSKKEVGLKIHTGRNRIVRRLFEHLGYKVIKLDRVVFAGLTKKDLPRGRWRFLTPAEVSMLYRK